MRVRIWILSPRPPCNLQEAMQQTSCMVPVAMKWCRWSIHLTQGVQRGLWMQELTECSKVLNWMLPVLTKHLTFGSNKGETGLSVVSNFLLSLMGVCRSKSHLWSMTYCLKWVIHFFLEIISLFLGQIPGMFLKKWLPLLAEKVTGNRELGLSFLGLNCGWIPRFLGSSHGSGLSKKQKTIVVVVWPVSCSQHTNADNSPGVI